MEKEKRSLPGKVRRILGDILVVLALLLTVDVAVVMLHKINTVVLKSDYITIFRYQLLICGVWLLAALDIRFGFFTALRWKAAKIPGWILRIAVMALAAVFLFFCGKVTAGGLIRSREPAENAIVLGMALEKGQPTADLLSRLDTAQAWLEQNPESRLILTGGNADESGRTEAAVMRDILLERGVPADRLILEDRAESTEDNFSNTAALLDPAQPVVLISSSYHMDRAAATAQKAGFSRILRFPAPSSLLTWGANMTWEIVLDINELGK